MAEQTKPLRRNELELEIVVKNNEMNLVSYEKIGFENFLFSIKIYGPKVLVLDCEFLSRKPHGVFTIIRKRG